MSNRDIQRQAILFDQIVTELHKRWMPHPAQVNIGRELLYKGTRYIFAECGRNFGKTDLVTYLFWRWAKSNPDSDNYYFAPYMKQAREIVWSSNRIQTFGPQKWVKNLNNTEMRISLDNGSFIKCDGSDNTESYRGVKIKNKGLVVLDEFKDFKPEFWQAMEPNIIDGYVLIIGTPPEPIPDENGKMPPFIQTAEEYKESASKAYFNYPSWCNPHVPMYFFNDKKKELYTKGEGYIFEREYGAKRVRGGVTKIFPMLDESLVYPHSQLIKEIERDKRKLDWFLWADPAAASCFAVLFIAINPYNRMIYVLDEIYETDQKKMTVQQIVPRIQSIRDELFTYRFKEWRQGYDEAETWFANEALDHFEESFEPTHKMKTDKITGIALIKDILLQRNIKISDRCQKFFWELDNAKRGKDGKIEKKNDHLIDDFRYILHAAYYDSVERQEYIEAHDEMFRGARIEDDFPGYTGMGEKMDEFDMEGEWTLE